MTANDKPVLIYTTFPTVAAAETVGAALVADGLAACVNIIPGMVSIYIWQGAVNRDQECVMLVKTRHVLAERVTKAVVAQHPYDNPAVLVLAVDGGAAPFLAWIEDQTAAVSRQASPDRAEDGRSSG